MREKKLEESLGPDAAWTGNRWRGEDTKQAARRSTSRKRVGKVLPFPDRVSCSGLRTKHTATSLYKMTSTGLSEQVPMPELQPTQGLRLMGAGLVAGVHGESTGGTNVPKEQRHSHLSWVDSGCVAESGSGP